MVIMSGIHARIIVFSHIRVNYKCLNKYIAMLQHYLLQIVTWKRNLANECGWSLALGSGMKGNHGDCRKEAPPHAQESIGSNGIGSKAVRVGRDVIPLSRSRMPCPSMRTRPSRKQALIRRREKNQDLTLRWRMV